MKLLFSILLLACVVSNSLTLQAQQDTADFFFQEEPSVLTYNKKKVYRNNELLSQHEVLTILNK
jgi:hypothetical protein